MVAGPEIRTESRGRRGTENGRVRRKWERRGSWAHGLRYRELPPCVSRVNNPHSIHPKQKKVYIPSLSHVAHLDLHTVVIHRSSLAYHLRILIYYLARYPPAHTPSGESLTDLIHRVTSGLIINVLLLFPTFLPPPLDLNDHRALLWNRPFVAPFQTKPLASYPSTPDRLTHLRLLLVT